MTTISAALNYADYGLLGLGGLLFLVCLSRGFGKSLYGFFFSLVIILASFYISGVATEPLLQTQVGTQFNTVVEDWSASWGDAFNNDIYFVGGTAVIYPAGTSDSATTLSDALGTNAIVGFVVDKIVPKFIPEEGGMSLADVIVPNIIYIGGYLIVFIASLVLLKVAFKIVGSLWDKLTRDGRSYKALDKIMGGAISLVYTAAFAMFALAVIGLFADKAFLAPVVDIVQSSEYCSWLFINNPILTIFAQLFFS